MKEFMTVNFDPAQCRVELDRLQTLLASKRDLSERQDLQPLFQSSPQHINFFGLLLIGRSEAISQNDRTRLHWRSDRVTVNTHRIYCQTYDDLCDALNNDWRLFSLASQK